MNFSENELRTVLITGALKGIGLAIAKKMYVSGCNVCLIGKADDSNLGLNEVAKQLNTLESDEPTAKVAVFPTDLTNEASIKDTVESIYNTYKNIDVVINNASVINLANTTDISTEMLNLMLDINVKASYLLIKFSIPYLKMSPNAHVLNIAPPINLEPKWLGAHVAYTSSRYLMGMMTVGLSTELKDYQISVNALWPKTSIASTDICNVISGTYVDNMKTTRDPSIMADAAHAIVSRYGTESTGEQFIDEESLIDFKGYTEEDFDKYVIDPEFKRNLSPEMYT